MTLKIYPKCNNRKLHRQVGERLNDEVTNSHVRCFACLKLNAILRECYFGPRQVIFENIALYDGPELNKFQLVSWHNMLLSQRIGRKSVIIKLAQQDSRCAAKLSCHTL